MHGNRGRLSVSAETEKMRAVLSDRLLLLTAQPPIARQSVRGAFMRAPFSFENKTRRGPAMSAAPPIR